MRLFISYAHTDKWQVNELVEILRQGNYDPWFDHRLVVGQDWKQQLLDAITNCDVFVYVLSPESVESEWCQWEFAEAVKLSKPIVPILIQTNTPIPPSILSRQYADFTEGATAQGVARLMAGIHQSIKIPPEEVNAPENPKGKPSQIISQNSVFISYSRDDKDYAYELEQYLSENGFRVWIDKHGLSVQDRWIRKIEKAIEDCAAFIIVMTPNSKESEWVQRELHYAEECGKPLFPLLLGGKIWFQLGTTQSIDVTDGTLPGIDFLDKLALFAHRDEKLVETSTIPTVESVYTLYLSYVASDPVVTPFVDHIQAMFKKDRSDWAVIASKDISPDTRQEILSQSTLAVFLLGVFYGTVDRDNSIVEEEYNFVVGRDTQYLVILLPDEMPAGVSLQILAQQSQLLPRQLDLRERVLADKENTILIADRDQITEQLIPVIERCIKPNSSDKHPRTQTTQAEDAERWKFFSDHDQSHVTYDRRLLDGNTLEDLDEHLIRQFLDRPLAKDVARRLGVRNPSVRKHMELLGLMRDGKIALGTFLCFAPPQILAHLFSSCGLQMVVYDNISKAEAKASIIDLTDNLLNLWEQGLDFLRDRSGLRRTGKVGSASRDDLEIPEIALREALANALVHRDYDLENKDQPTRIEVFPDQVIITSFGKLSSRISEKSLNEDPEKVVSIRRNPIIARIFQYMTYVELNASGISRMHNELKKVEGYPPIIEQDEDLAVVRTTFKRRIPIMHNLPPSSPTSFVGRHREIQIIEEYINSTSSQNIILISGVGGIGKTTLALQVANKVLAENDSKPIMGRFDLVAWVTAKDDFLTSAGISSVGNGKHDINELLRTIGFIINFGNRESLDDDKYNSSLLAKLNDLRSLIVIDNFESFRDQEEFINQLISFPPSVKFVITSRLLISEANVRNLELRSLTLQETHQMLKAEFTAQNIDNEMEIDSERIWQVTNGMPLIIKYLVGSMSSRGLTLDHALKQFETGGQSNDLFRYVFEQSWNALSEAQKAILIAIAKSSSVANIITFEEIERLLDITINLQDFTELRKLSLLEIKDNQIMIHPLTKNFVLMKVDDISD